MKQEIMFDRNVAIGKDETEKNATKRDIPYRAKLPKPPPTKI